MNNSGYARLIELASLAYTESPRREVLPEDIILSDCENLIVLSGGIKGHIWDVVQRNDLKTAITILKKWKEKLGNRYFLELTRTGRMQEEDHVQELLKLGTKEVSRLSRQTMSVLKIMMTTKLMKQEYA